MKVLSTVVFLAAFLGWAWLEFGAPGTREGVQDILFWVGMWALLANRWHGQRPRSAT